ncbi:MAG: hypothetical protein ACLFQB_12870 [Chitinispirillaceae bacterium]
MMPEKSVQSIPYDLRAGERSSDTFYTMLREFSTTCMDHICTAGVSEFLTVKHPSYRGREDELFCGKEKIEYFLNMVASELMNRGLREQFENTSERVVLVPGCMRAQPASRAGHAVREWIFHAPAVQRSAMS